MQACHFLKSPGTAKDHRHFCKTLQQEMQLDDKQGSRPNLVLLFNYCNSFVIIGLHLQRETAAKAGWERSDDPVLLLPCE